jgi:hypothetical protein
VIYVYASGPSDPEAAFISSATRPVATTPPAEEEPPVEESSIEAEVSITAPFTRLTPADPVGVTYPAHWRPSATSKLWKLILGYRKVRRSTSSTRIGRVTSRRSHRTR